MPYLEAKRNEKSLYFCNSSKDIKLGRRRKKTFCNFKELFKSDMSYENRLDREDLVNIPFDIDILIYNETKVSILILHDKSTNLK